MNKEEIFNVLVERDLISSESSHNDWTKVQLSQMLNADNKTDEEVVEEVVEVECHKQFTIPKEYNSIYFGVTTLQSNIPKILVSKAIFDIVADKLVLNDIIGNKYERNLTSIVYMCNNNPSKNLILECNNKQLLVRVSDYALQSKSITNKY